MQWKQVVSVLILSLCAAASPAATSQAEVHFTDLKVVLTDLDPGDGIDPWISWESSGFLLLEVPYFDSVDGPWGDLELTGEGFNLKAASDGFHMVADATHLSGLRATGGREGSFTLSPQTQVTFAGFADIKLTGADQFKEHFAWANISLQVGGNAAPYVFSSERLEDSGALSKWMSLVYKNENNEQIGGYVGYFPGIHLVDRISAVPEADLWMLVLAGLGATAVVGRAGRRHV